MLYVNTTTNVTLPDSSQDSSRDEFTNIYIPIEDIGETTKDVYPVSIDGDGNLNSMVSSERSFENKSSGLFNNTDESPVQLGFKNQTLSSESKTGGYISINPDMQTTQENKNATLASNGSIAISRSNLTMDTQSNITDIRNNTSQRNITLHEPQIENVTHNRNNTSQKNTTLHEKNPFGERNFLSHEKVSKSLHNETGPVIEQLYDGTPEDYEQTSNNYLDSDQGTQDKLDEVPNIPETDKDSYVVSKSEDSSSENLPSDIKNNTKQYGSNSTKINTLSRNDTLDKKQTGKLNVSNPNNVPDKSISSEDDIAAGMIESLFQDMNSENAEKRMIHHLGTEHSNAYSRHQIAKKYKWVYTAMRGVNVNLKCGNVQMVNTLNKTASNSLQTKTQHFKKTMEENILKQFYKKKSNGLKEDKSTSVALVGTSNSSLERPSNKNESINQPFASNTTNYNKTHNDQMFNCKINRDNDLLNSVETSTNLKSLSDEQMLTGHLLQQAALKSDLLNSNNIPDVKTLEEYDLTAPQSKFYGSVADHLSKPESSLSDDDSISGNDDGDPVSELAPEYI